jgi:hypothetical protein
MIYNIYNTKDASIHEQYTILNTGLDAILQIDKTFVDSVPYNSRALVQFDLSRFTQNYTTTILTQTASYYLRLTVVEADEIPLNYSLYAHPISGSWNMGTGRYTTMPTSSDGASWKYRLSSENTASAWATSSFTAGSTGSYLTNPGGGNWYNAYVHSQSFNYETADILMDVTSTVRAWISGTLDNQGFIIKRSNADEQSTDTLGSLKFFSKDTHTIYGPGLEMRYNDSVYHTSYSLVDFDDEVTVNLTNLRNQYGEGDKARFNVSVRPKYPNRSFATSSDYLDTYQLISSSFYSIRDAHTNTVIIPFDEANTVISADNKGSYFKLNLDGLIAERYYRVLIKSKIDSTEQYIFDNNWIFKVSQ